MLKLLEALDLFLTEATRARKRRVLAGLEKRLKGELARAFQRQGRALVKALGTRRVREAEGEVSQDDLDHYLDTFDEVAEETRSLFAEALQDAMSEALAAGAQAVIEELGLKLNFELKNPRAVAYLEAHGAELVRGVNDTTRNTIKTLVTDGIRQGSSPDKIARQIIAQYNEFAVGKPQQHIKSRAHLIAVTEVGGAYCEGNVIVAQDQQEAGLKMEKRWLTVKDNRVSKGCLKNQEAEWIPLDDPFPSGHQRPLRFPGCRCDILLRRARTKREAT
jgi:hypothetical protein